MLQTEFDFTLPMGFVDKDGNLHRNGVMRLANARDEIAPLQDPRVQRNQAYLAVILLSRVVTRLGDLRDINPAVVESLFSADLAYLQDLYRRINSAGHSRAKVLCPSCEHEFEVSDSVLNGGNGLEG
ncbi:MAG: hypothetical protein WBW69_23540 [Candidatus Korobacteraceae bacterium]